MDNEVPEYFQKSLIPEVGKIDLTQWQGHVCPGNVIPGYQLEDCGFICFQCLHYTICTVTNKVIPRIKTMAAASTGEGISFVWLDTIHNKLREDNRYQSKAVQTALALNLEGKKEVPGQYLTESEGG